MVETPVPLPTLPALQPIDPNARATTNNSKSNGNKSTAKQANSNAPKTTATKKRKSEAMDDIPRPGDIRDYLRISASDSSPQECQKFLGISGNSWANFMKMRDPNAGGGCEAYKQAIYKLNVTTEQQGLRVLAAIKYKNAITTAPDDDDDDDDDKNQQEESQDNEQEQQQQQQQQQPSPPPSKKSKKSPNNAPAKKKSATESKKEAAASALDTGRLILDGEPEQDVPVYMTCDELRRTITAFLRKNPSVTNAALARALTTSYPADSGISVPSHAISRFQGLKKGSMSGNTNVVFYAGYVFFEKKRILEGKKKSRFREEMEEIHGDDGGLDVVHQANGEHYFCFGGERPSRDRYGRLFIGGKEMRRPTGA